MQTPSTLEWPVAYRFQTRKVEASFLRAPVRVFAFAALAAASLLGVLLPGSAHGQSIFGRVIVAGDTTGVSGAELVLTDFATLPSHRGRGLATFPPATGSLTSSESVLAPGCVRPVTAQVEGWKNTPRNGKTRPDTRTS